MRYPRGSIPTLARGEFISADHYASVTNAAQEGFTYPTQGVGDYQGVVNYPKPAYPDQVLVYSNVEIPQHSVFLFGKTGSTTAATFPVSQFNSEPVGVNSIFPRRFLTNEAGIIYANSTGWATMITPYKPIKVLGSAVYPPSISKACGAELFEASNRATGLMCVATLQDYFVEVVAYDPMWYRGKILTPVSAGSYSSPTTCLVDVWLPDPTSSSLALLRSVDPSLLGLTVYNYDPCLSSYGTSSSSSGGSSGAVLGSDLCRIEHNWNCWNLVQVSGCIEVVVDASCDSSGGLTVTKGKVRK